MVEAAVAFSSRFRVRNGAFDKTRVPRFFLFSSYQTNRDREFFVMLKALETEPLETPQVRTAYYRSDDPLSNLKFFVDLKCTREVPSTADSADAAAGVGAQVRNDMSQKSVLISWQQKIYGQRYCSMCILFFLIVSEKFPHCQVQSINLDFHRKGSPFTLILVSHLSTLRCPVW